MGTHSRIPGPALVGSISGALALAILLLVGMPTSTVEAGTGALTWNAATPGPKAAAAGCAKAAPPKPYDHDHNHHFNGTGTLDTGLVIDAEVAMMHNFEQMMDDLQARTEQMRCEAGNTELLLGSAGGGTGTCALEPPTPYAPYPPNRLGDGLADYSELNAASTTLMHSGIDILGDLQARVRRVLCDQGRIAQASGNLVAPIATGTTAPGTAAQPCTDPEPAPAYLHHHARFDVNGFMNFHMAMNSVAATDEALEGWMEDLRNRVQSVRCQQASVKARLNAAIAARLHDMLSLHSATTAAAGRVAQAAPPVPRVAAAAPQFPQAPRLQTRNQAAALASVLATPAAAATSPVTVPPRPREADCSRLGPDPTYVEPIRHVVCNSRSCTPDDEFAINLLAALRRELQQAAGDLQLRLARSACEQKNINVSAAYFNLLIGKPAAAPSPWMAIAPARRSVN